MKFIKKTVSLLLAASVIFCSISVSVSADDSAEIETVIFGSYPQAQVTDTALVSELNSLNPEWQSYGYFSGTGTYDDGRMAEADYMKFADVELEGCRYRGVKIENNRPSFTGYSAGENSYQQINGYEKNGVYWFRYEPLEWRIIDPEKGYIICESIIDSQPFENRLYFSGDAYYMDGQYYDYANYYVNSSIRKWLNSDFADTAFTEAEKEKIAVNYMDDFWADIYDKVFLPSANEMKNTSYWKDDSSKIASGTDYAECQGLFVDSGKSYWRLRSPADWSQNTCSVCTDGTVYGYNYYYRCYPYETSFTGTGVRPAVKLENLNDSSLNRTFKTVEPPSIEVNDKMSFAEKISGFFIALKSIIGYYLSQPEETNQNAVSVINSLKKGINIPCMESGWAREWIIEKSTYENIAGHGFDYVRIPTNLVCMLDENGGLNSAAMHKLDNALSLALDSGLTVILDMHGWEELNRNPSSENIRTLVTVWQKIAQRYKDYPDKLCFEIMNEPSGGNLSDFRWNFIQNTAVSAIREADEDRILVLSTNNYNAVTKLRKLKYNHKDPYIIIDIHNYAPFEFTHQGAEWVDGMEEKVAYSEETTKAFAESINVAADFRKKNGTKIIIGEFGAYLKQTSQEDISAFLTSAVKCMNENDLPWAYWEYYAGFGAYDCSTKQWKPFILDALMTE